MPISVRHVDSPSAEALALLLDHWRSGERAYAGSTAWTGKVLAALPERLQAFSAVDSDGPVGLLLLSEGFLEPWGVPADLLGGNPILPQDETAAAIHAALLIEAVGWAQRQDSSGLEILLPMGPANMQRNQKLDRFYERLGFARFYYTMTRTLGSLNECPKGDRNLEIVPAASIDLEALFINYSACTAHGEIELVARQSTGERQHYFVSLAEETLGHPASLALIDEDRLLGFTLAAATAEATAHLAWIGVLPNHRCKGLGRQLLCRALQACQEEHTSRMSLYTDTSVGAQTLYHQLGFEPAGALTYRWRRAPQ